MHIYIICSINNIQKVANDESRLEDIYVTHCAWTRYERSIPSRLHITGRALRRVMTGGSYLVIYIYDRHKTHMHAILKSLLPRACVARNGTLRNVRVSVIVVLRERQHARSIPTYRKNAQDVQCTP